MGRLKAGGFRERSRRSRASLLQAVSLPLGEGVFLGRCPRLRSSAPPPEQRPAGGELPLDRRMVTPVALVDSPLTTVVHSNFPEPPPQQ